MKVGDQVECLFDKDNMWRPARIVRKLEANDGVIEYFEIEWDSSAAKDNMMTIDGPRTIFEERFSKGLWNEIRHEKLKVP